MGYGAEIFRLSFPCGIAKQGHVRDKCMRAGVTRIDTFGYEAGHVYIVNYEVYYS